MKKETPKLLNYSIDVEESMGEREDGYNTVIAAESPRAALIDAVTQELEAFIDAEEDGDPETLAIKILDEELGAGWKIEDYTGQMLSLEGRYFEFSTPRLMVQETSDTLIEAFAVKEGWAESTVLILLKDFIRDQAAQDAHLVERLSYYLEHRIAEQEEEVA